MPFLAPYHAIMAVCTAIAFFAALRVGEITFRIDQSSKNAVQLSQISFLASPNGKTSAIKLTMRFFKHSNLTRPVDIYLHKSQRTVLSGYYYCRVSKC